MLLAWKAKQTIEIIQVKAEQENTDVVSREERRVGILGNLLFLTHLNPALVGHTRVTTVSTPGILCTTVSISRRLTRKPRIFT